MAWSTRELADLAGTTVNTVRHYHRLGLLAEPDRRYNGYKQYGVPHLVRLLRIRRLADLGIPLSEVAGVLDGDDDSSDALRQLDAELAAGIERLERARGDIAAILRDSAPADGPAGFESVSSTLSQADSSLIHIYTQLYDEAAMDDLRRMAAEDPTPPEARQEMDTLPDDADEATRQRLAELLAPSIAQNLRDFAWLSEPAGRFAKGEQVAQQTFLQAVAELYNPAQRDVLVRASILANEELRRQREADSRSDTDPGAAPSLA
jgi:DNA-binding transcriptional MerR regulator